MQEAGVMESSSGHALQAPTTPSMAPRQMRPVRLVPLVSEWTTFGRMLLVFTMSHLSGEYQ